jgi:DNA polymerase-1
VNSVIQGSAADLNKLAMIRINDLREPDMHILLTVHDEFVFEAPEDKAEEAHEIVREGMLGSGIQELISVPLRVDSHVVARWGDAK